MLKKKCSCWPPLNNSTKCQTVPTQRVASRTASASTPEELICLSYLWHNYFFYTALFSALKMLTALSSRIVLHEWPITFWISTKVVYLQCYFHITFWISTKVEYLQSYFHITFLISTKVVYLQCYFHITFWISTKVEYLQSYFHITFLISTEVVYLQCYFHIILWISTKVVYLQCYFDVALSISTSGVLTVLFSYHVSKSTKVVYLQCYFHVALWIPEWCTYSAVLLQLLDECPFRCNLLTKSQKIKTMYLNTSMWCGHHFSHKAFANYVKNIMPPQTICHAHNYWGVLFCRLFQSPTVCG